MPNTKEIVTNVQNYAKEDKAKVEVVDYFKNIVGEYEISVVSPEDNWLYLQTGHASATKYSYTQADLIFENTETDFIEEYVSAINENRPRFIMERCGSKLYSNKISGSLQLRYDEAFRNDQFIVYELNGNLDAKEETDG